MGYLLDTNIISDLVDHRFGGRVGERLAALREQGETDIVTSIVVAAELRFGAAKRRSSRLTRRIEEVLGAVDVLPLEVPADAVYARLRAELEHEGRPLGGNDLLIAAHALAGGHTLVTADGGFDRVAGLPRENWLTA